MEDVKGIVLAGGLGGYVGVAIKGVTNVVLGGVVKSLSDPLIQSVKSMGDDEKKLTVLGKTGKANLRVDSSGSLTVRGDGCTWDQSSGTLTMRLVAPKDLVHKPKKDIKEAHEKTDWKTMVHEGEANGAIILKVSAERVGVPEVAV